PRQGELPEGGYPGACPGGSLVAPPLPAPTCTLHAPLRRIGHPKVTQRHFWPIENLLPARTYGGWAKATLRRIWRGGQIGRQRPIWVWVAKVTLRHLWVGQIGRSVRFGEPADERSRFRQIRRSVHFGLPAPLGERRLLPR